MTQGHRGSLLLRCRAFSSLSSCRFIPALSPRSPRNRSMREAPALTPTASPRLRRSSSTWPPHRTDKPASELVRVVSSTRITRCTPARYPSGLSRHWTYGASDSGSSRTPSHHGLPDPGHLTVPTRPVRCRGCSHHPVRSHVPAAPSFTSQLRLTSGGVLSPPLDSPAPRGARTASNSHRLLPSPRRSPARRPGAHAA